MRLSGLLNLRRSGQAKRVTVPCAAQWATHSTCLNDQLEVKVQRKVTARPMSLMGLVSRVTPVHTAKRNCTRDGGGPFGFGNQVLISSHRKLLRLNTVVVSVAETPGR